MSVQAILFAVIAGVLTFILMNAMEPINPILITNILLGFIAGLLIDQRNNKKGV